MTPAETNYAQIEKECLACTWDCKRLSQYLVGLDSFTLITDHKPLLPHINTRDITNTPARVQRMLLRLMIFNVTAVHYPSKEMLVADALSRNPIAIENKTRKDVEYLVGEIEAHVMMIETCFPATAEKLEEIRQRIMSDPTLQRVVHFMLHGWPNQSRSIDPSLKMYHAERANLTYTDGLPLFCDRLVIPAAMRLDILERIHEGHWGITKCKENHMVTTHVKQHQRQGVEMSLVHH